MQLQTEIEQLEAQSQATASQLQWYNSFNAGAAATAMREARREVERLGPVMADLQAKVVSMTGQAGILGREASLGWNPKQWFSAERKAAKAALRDTKLELANVSAHHDATDGQIQALTALVSRHAADIKRHQEYDPETAKATADSLHVAVQQKRAALSRAQTLAQQLDEQLKDPLKELELAQRAMGSASSRRGIADELDKRLKAAPDGRSRREIHQQCEASFGVGSPGRVAADARREVESLERTIRKLETRIQAIAKSATRQIDRVVIDGSNLCYAQSTFIGPAALQAAANRLAQDRAVFIVFDASIRQKLRMNDRDIAGIFSASIVVHVVASKAKADETLLDIADESSTYVISNDRFSDFRDKSAVREQRIIRHEIVAGKVMIADLNLNETFE